MKNRSLFGFVLLLCIGYVGPIFGGGSVSAVALKTPKPGQQADPFEAVQLGVGGNQHYPDGPGRRYFTNIVASAVGDLDGDGLQDIVLLANAIPQNGAYSGATPRCYTYTHFTQGAPEAFMPGQAGVYWQGEFLISGDYLYQAALKVAGLDPAVKTTNWYDNTGDQFSLALGTHSMDGFMDGIDNMSVAPPSPNVAAGMLDGTYTGSDLAWLRGDGRGHFSLRFITPMGPDGQRRPARIRMGKAIRLARLNNSPFVKGLDIVLISGDNFETNGKYPRGQTVIEPFSGAGRVLWLENTGWEGGVVGSQLNFTDHGIAEYNQDRLPVLFYGAAGSDGLNLFTTLNPNSVSVLDIDGDGLEDILVGDFQNENNGGLAASTMTYTVDISTSDFLNKYYSDKIPRPNIGDRWVVNRRFWGTIPDPVIPKQAPSLFWYKNNDTPGQPRFSTATYHAALDKNGNPFTDNIARMISLNLDNGTTAFVTISNSDGQGRDINVGDDGSNLLRIYRRDASLPNELKLHLTDTQITPQVIQFQLYEKISAAQIDGRDGQELVVLQFRCDSAGCYHHLQIWGITSNGNLDVNVQPLWAYDFVPVQGAVIQGPVGDFFVEDVNGDGKNDIVTVTKSLNGTPPNSNPAVVFLNTTNNIGNVSFTPVIQHRPNLLNTGKELINYYSHSGLEYTPLNRMVSVAAGDFNGDGLTDFVRTSPNALLTLFTNQIDGLQRARITATVQHQTGTTKSFTAIYGGEMNGTNVRISTQAVGGIGVQAVPSQ